MRKQIVVLTLTFALLAALMPIPPIARAAPRTPGDVPNTLPPLQSQYFPHVQAVTDVASARAAFVDRQWDLLLTNFQVV